MRIAGIIRKSPTKKNVEENIKIQIHAITEWCSNKFGINYDLDLYIDKNVSGDDPNRPELMKLFEKIDDYDFAVCHVVDRYIRSWLGLKWFFEYFTTNNGESKHDGCRLKFVQEMPDLYKEDGSVEGTAIFIFGVYCMKAYCELLDIRRRTKQGIKRLTPEERKEKYKGRKKGAKSNKTIELEKKIRMYQKKGYDIKTISDKLERKTYIVRRIINNIK